MPKLKGLGRDPGRFAERKVGLDCGGRSSSSRSFGVILILTRFVPTLMKVASPLGTKPARSFGDGCVPPGM